MTEQPLDDVGVLLTRPREQARELRDAIRSRGGRAILFPVIEIRARDESEVTAELAALPAADITIFISQNAVEHGLRFADGEHAAIGPSTAAALEAAGERVAIQPSAGYDSEHLLQEPEFADVGGKTIRIIRGGDGRELLGDTLRARGARVDYLSTYERRLPTCSARQLADLETCWHAGDIDAVVVMSVQSLNNLDALLPAWCARQLPKTPLVTPATRVLQEALDRYPGCPATLAAGPQTKDMVDAIAAAVSA